MTELQPKILIIVPHGYCVNNKERDCDTRAAEMADVIARLASSLKYEVKLIQSDNLRSEFDYNRRESFDTLWRQSVRNYIENNASYPIIIYEVHSFPRDFTEFDEGSQMALLAIDEYYEKTKSLHDYLKCAGIKISEKINRTRVVNLMVDTSKYSNIKHHYLLEFNEDENILTRDESNYAILNVLSASMFPIISNKKNILLVFLIICVFLVILVIYGFSGSKIPSVKSIPIPKAYRMGLRSADRGSP